ncbi:MAG TPA: PQQ-binding-like beta-propeller repeat protein, partial [Pyrinomonadaceae bacterium]|nr:PQQ-binding-like beta-propeller repeat protein [Pyrinomonadaceae bacterium]
MLAYAFDRLRAGIIIAVTVTLLLSSSCRRPDSQAHNNQIPSRASNAEQAAQAQSAQTEDGQWLMATKDYANTRFSALNQINAQNVNQLKLAWTFSTGGTRGEEAAPLVVGDTMYIVTPFPNYLYALDLTKPGAPMKWKYDPKPAASAQGVACCDVVNR